MVKPLGAATLHDAERHRPGSRLTISPARGRRLARVTPALTGVDERHWGSGIFVGLAGSAPDRVVMARASRAHARACPIGGCSRRVAAHLPCQRDIRPIPGEKSRSGQAAPRRSKAVTTVGVMARAGGHSETSPSTVGRNRGQWAALGLGLGRWPALGSVLVRIASTSSVGPRDPAPELLIHRGLTGGDEAHVGVRRMEISPLWVAACA